MCVCELVTYKSISYVLTPSVRVVGERLADSIFSITLTVMLFFRHSLSDGTLHVLHFLMIAILSRFLKFQCACFAIASRSFVIAFCNH